MSRLDDRLTRELERAARPASPAGTFERVDHRRARRQILRRVQAAGLAVVVLAGTIGGFAFLSNAFREPEDGIGDVPPVRNGLIVYSEVRNAGQRLWVVEPDGTGARQLTTGDGASDTGPSISPDGQLVAFTRTDEQGSAIYAVGIDGTGLRRVTEPGWSAFDPTWSPDASRIMFAGEIEGYHGLYTIDLRTSGVVPITDDTVAGASDPSWSRDGRLVTFSAHDPEVRSEPIDRDLYIFDMVDATTLNLTHSPEASETQPTFSPNGAQIAFVRVFNTLDDTPTGGIAVILADGTGFRQLTDDHAFEQHPTWAPDGSVIAFDRDDPAGTSIFTIRPDGSDLTRITLGSDPAWQPVPAGLSSSPVPSPAPTDSQPVDIGLGFPVCNVEALNGDFDGDGIVDTAWTASKATDVGPCPTFDGSFTVVAVDITGDGVADGSAGPLEHCVACHPFAATDLDGDGVRELVVIAQWASTTEYTLFSIHPERAEAGQALEWVTVAPPGDPDADFQAGEPFMFWAGGDAGYASYVRCTGDRPDLLITQTSHPVEGPGSDVRRVQYTELRLVDGRMQVMDRNDSTEPNTEPFDGWTGPACGVHFWPGS